MSKRADTSMQLAYDELNRAFHRAYDRAEKAAADLARLRRLSVRLFDECGNGIDHPDCSYSAVCINGYLHCNKCGFIEKDAACDGKGVVLRDGAVKDRHPTLCDDQVGYWFPASWMEGGTDD